MALGVDGQFFLSISLNGNTTFLNEEDLEELTIYEYAGNILPTFDLSFKSNDESIFKSLNEGNSLQVQVGKNSNNSVDISLFPSTLRTAKDGPDQRYYEIKGFAANIGYITNHNLQITTAKSGIEVALETAANNFSKVESNITKSNDSQKWIQHNISDKQFLNDVILHSDLGTSFPVYGITADNIFILNDLVDSLNQPFKWRLTKNPLKDNDIVYDSDTTVDSKAGFINSWIGYGKELKVINSDSGTVESVFEDPSVIMSMAKELDKSKDISRRFGGVRHKNGNVHANYWASFNHNLQSLANLSKIDNTLSFTDSFFPVKPLDIIMFNEESLSNSLQSGEENSGLYITSGVIRTYQMKRISTTLILNRESFNQVKNT